MKKALLIGLVIILVFVVWLYVAERPANNLKNSTMASSSGLISPADQSLQVGQQYEDTSFGFSFTSPVDFHINSSGDETLLYQTPSDGGGGQQGWPRIEIDYPQASAYYPPAGASLIAWLKQNNIDENVYPSQPNMQFGNVPAVKIYTPSSTQIYGQCNIYYIRGRQLYRINLDDVDSSQAQAIYNQFLSSYKILL